MTSPNLSTTKVVSTMGSRLRERRSRLGLSISEAARRASISPSHLSAVEAGSSTASLAVLARITHALDTTIGEFLAEDTDSSIRLGSFGTTPGFSEASSEDLQLRVHFHVAEPLSRGTWAVDDDDASVVVVVRSGAMSLNVDGETWHLAEGDSLHAQEASSIAWSADEGATAVWVVAPAG